MTSPSPVPPPEGEVPQPPPPSYALFNSDSVALATFLGTTLSGSILMAVNYRRLGKGASAAATVLIGLAVTAMALLVGYAIPRSGATIIALALLFGTRAAAKGLQGAAVAQHVSRGGKLGSKWVAAGLGVALLAVFVGGYLLGYGIVNPKVQIGTKDEVFYSGSATKPEAQALGDKLKSIGFLGDRGASVVLSKGKDGTVVSFVVKDGIWNDRAMVGSFEEIGRLIAPAVGGFPLKVRLMNSDREVKKEVVAGKTVIGTLDEVYYFGTATEVEAKALGQALQTAGFFHDKGFSVLLYKGEGTVLAFVVKEGFWEAPENVAMFDKVTRQVAPSVGGLPITLRLVNNSIDTKKEVTVQ